MSGLDPASAAREVAYMLGERYDRGVEEAVAAVVAVAFERFAELLALRCAHDIHHPGMRHCPDCGVRTATLAVVSS